ncbi:MAG: hypothetical protein ACT4P7_05035 [Gemmatimonadaceae bacterium]
MKTTMRASIASLILAALLVSACADSTSPTSPEMPRATDVAVSQATASSAPACSSDCIAFTSNRDGNWEIYTVNADGGPTRLTNNRRRDEYPAWSPDRTKIVFASTRDRNWEIYVMNADGTNPTRLTTNAASDLAPAWSPDGSKIAFASMRDRNWEIYVMNVDGTGVTRLTASKYYDQFPSWSPDGTKIAFNSSRIGNQQEIFVMNADGSGVTRLTTQMGMDYDPVWSPDGSKIAFTGTVGGSHDIYSVNADGTGLNNLSSRMCPSLCSFVSAAQMMPSWSRDGSQIVFASDWYPAGTSPLSLFAMNADGTGAARLPNQSRTSYQPAW